MTFERFCSDGCKPRCEVEGCDRPRRKRGWCASHYVQWQKTGLPPKPFLFEWGKPGTCDNCGGWADRRPFCSHNCRAAFRVHGGPRPVVAHCIACGIAIDLNEVGKHGQRRKATVKFCRPCKADYSKYKMSARELAERDGTDCGICGEPVDMTLRRSQSLMCASVDHIVPRAKGGTHEPDNLQLAHLYCNQVKSDRTG